MRIHFALRWLLILLIVAVLVLYVFPYAYLLLTSIKPANEAISIPPTLLPSRVSFENYLRIGDFPHVPRSFFNSALIAALSTFFALALGVPASYAISRFSTLPGRFFLIIALVTRMIPYVSVALPLFAMMRVFHLSDTHLAVALAHTVVSLPLAIWLLVSFFEGIPVELEEAAKVDGATRLGALLRIIVPVAAGGIAVTAIFCFLASWNEFLFSLLLTSVDAKTAPIAIAEFKTQYGVEWGTMTALSILYSLPVILFSLFMQKRIVAGMTMGAVKG